MRKYVPGENNQLFNTLTASGVDKKVARELQNVHNYCNFPMFEFVNDNKTDYPVGSEVFYILEKGVTPEELEVLLAGSAKVSVAVLDKKLALKANSGNITIERSRYAIIFKNAGLPVKTFKL